MFKLINNIELWVNYCDVKVSQLLITEITATIHIIGDESDLKSLLKSKSILISNIYHIDIYMDDNDNDNNIVVTFYYR